MWIKFWTRLRHIQSNVYLPAARTAMLVGALSAFLAAVISILIAGYFQTQSWHSASTSTSLPPVYVSRNPKIALDLVASKLTGPANIRFISFKGVISSPLNKNKVIGQFEADAVNGLPAPPNDFSLLGGTDIHFFTPVRGAIGLRNPLAHYPRLLGTHSASFKYGLVASEALNNLVRKAVAAGKIQSRSFCVRVIAFDKLGNKSKPQNVSFTLRFGPKSPTAAANALSVTPHTSSTSTTQLAKPTVQQTPLTLLAREIALVADPKRGPTFFKVFRKACNVPHNCGVDRSDAVFIADYRKAFEFAKNRITPDNVISGFLPSICEAWRTGVAAKNRAEGIANVKRLQILAEAQAAKTKADLLNSSARSGRDVALRVMLGAIGVLLLISLPLALLLLENHSSALRTIAERLEADRVAGHPNKEGT